MFLHVFDRALSRAKFYLSPAKVQKGGLKTKRRRGKKGKQIQRKGRRHMQINYLEQT